ncbi:hypothetical protein BKA70DRAFT_725922 [Coprinopsis sp. MPI-PUGE-AT-0042]|nr:hypothetical protein BKA70DRAFT_725922 [Coprinopsis sp. MPI-PUGE-AT-0042]
MQDEMSQANRAQEGRSETIHALQKTLYSYATEEELSGIQVPLQIQYKNARRLLTESEADSPCSSFNGIQGLLDRLNEVLGTNHILDAEAGEEKGGLLDALQQCIDEQWDLGTAYGYLEPRWWDGGRELKTTMDSLKRVDMETRASAIDSRSGRITRPWLAPRRVWDLHCNRVLPQWIMGMERHPWAVSHSWMYPDMRQDVWTTINGNEWPVPIPKDTSLARVRVELLNLGARYVWLDVLCLRQVGPAEREGIRLEEWKLDVPTIGSIYQQNQLLVYYLSGLGRPFVLGDLDNERHWLNRAWTLQEISMNGLRAGIHPGSNYIMDPQTDEKGGYRDQGVARFDEAFANQLSLTQQENVFDVLRAMRKRAATGELDKIAGLGYLLGCKSLPQYDTTKTSNQAFSKMLEVISSRYCGDIFFRFPRSGTDLDSGRLWAPSWDQILSVPQSELPETRGNWLMEDVRFTEDGRSWYEGFWADGVGVTGFSTKDPQNGRREGLLHFKDDEGKAHTFRVQPTHSHQVEIPDGEYTVALDLVYIVVGNRGVGGEFAKVSVLKLLGKEEEEGRMEDREFRRKLGILKRTLFLL